MTHQPPRCSLFASADPGRQIAQLRHVLALVDEIAGRAATPAGDDSSLEEAARISVAYGDALPIDRRRFDAYVAEAAARAAAGVEALLAVQDSGRTPRAAAARLAEALDRALARLTTVLPA